MFDGSGLGAGEPKMEETKRLARVLKIAGRILSQPNYWHRARLSAEFETSERSIDRDMSLLRGLGFEITHSKTRGYAFTQAPALPPVPLSVPDVLALTLAAELARESGDIDPASLGSALTALLNALPRASRPLLQRELAWHQRASRSNTARRTMLGALQRAWLERRQVRMVYSTASRDGAISERVVEVFAIYPYERSWMVTAYDHNRQAVRDFKIDRVTSATLLDTTYEIPATFDLAAYRHQSWGVMRGVGGDPVSVALLFDAQGGRWVQEERRPETLVVETRADGQVLVRTTTSITPEFVRWIVWYGTHCRVLGPDTLCAEVRDTLRRTLAQYGDNPSQETKGDAV